MPANSCVLRQQYAQMKQKIQEVDQTDRKKQKRLRWNNEQY